MIADTFENNEKMKIKSVSRINKHAYFKKKIRCDIAVYLSMTL